MPVWNFESLFSIAVSGSLRPLPVSTQTTVAPKGTSSRRLISPATEAALAGSQKIPSPLPSSL